MGPRRPKSPTTPSLADRIKSANNSPLQPLQRPTRTVQQPDRRALVRKFIQLYIREAALRPVMLQCIHEARETNRDIIKLYSDPAVPSTSKQDQIASGTEVESINSKSSKGSKSKEQTTRRLSNISEGTSLADRVNKLTLSTSGTSDQDPHAENNIQNRVGVTNSLSGVKSVDKNVEQTTCSVAEKDSMVLNTAHGEQDESVIRLESDQGNTIPNSLDIDTEGHESDIRESLEPSSSHHVQLDNKGTDSDGLTQTVNNSLIYASDNGADHNDDIIRVKSGQNKNEIEPFSNLFEGVLDTPIVIDKNANDHKIVTVALIESNPTNVDANPEYRNIGNNSVPEKRFSKTKRVLVPRYKPVQVELGETHERQLNKTATSPSSNSDSQKRPTSSTSTASILPLSEPEEQSTYTTDELLSSSGTSPDIIQLKSNANLKMSKEPHPIDPSLGLKHKTRPQSLPDTQHHAKLTGPKTYRKQVLTETYFSDNDFGNKTKEQVKTIHKSSSYESKSYETDTNRARISKMINGQTRTRLLQTQLKKFGNEVLTNNKKKTSVSSNPRTKINPRTALNEDFLTSSPEFSQQTNPFHEYPHKLRWFLKSGELEYDERYTFEEKRQTKSKAYMKIQRLHYNKRPPVTDTGYNDLDTPKESKAVKQNIYHKPHSESRYQKEPQRTFMPNNVHLRKGMITKPLPKRKPFITVV